MEQKWHLAKLYLLKKKKKKKKGQKGENRHPHTNPKAK